jgi:hypothetical protein
VLHPLQVGEAGLGRVGLVFDGKPHPLAHLDQAGNARHPVTYDFRRAGLTRGRERPVDGFTQGLQGTARVTHIGEVRPRASRIQQSREGSVERGVGLLASALDRCTLAVGGGFGGVEGRVGASPLNGVVSRRCKDQVGRGVTCGNVLSGGSIAERADRHVHRCGK